MSPVYGTLTAPSWLPGGQSQARPAAQSPSTQLLPGKSPKRAALGGTAVGGGGWGSRLAGVSAAATAAAETALQRLQRGGFFLAELGQCKLPLPVGHVSERETILLRWGKSRLLCGDRKHTHTHTHRNRVGVGESESVSERES